MKPLEGDLIDLIEDFSEGRVQFAFVKVKDPNTTLPKYILIGWVSGYMGAIYLRELATDHVYSAAKEFLREPRATLRAISQPFLRYSMFVPLLLVNPATSVLTLGIGVPCPNYS